MKENPEKTLEEVGFIMWHHCHGEGKRSGERKRGGSRKQLALRRDGYPPPKRGGITRIKGGGGGERRESVGGGREDARELFDDYGDITSRR